MLRTHLKFTEFVNCSAGERHSVLVKENKKFSAMVAVLKSLANNGLESHGFYHTFKHQSEFLAMSPSVEMQFPKWMVLRMHFTAADLASPKQFWGFVASDAMITAGVGAESF